MPETCANWLGLVNSCVYCEYQTCEIFTKHCITQWISKLSGSFEINRVKLYLANVVLFRMKDLLTFEMTLMLNLNVIYFLLKSHTDTLG